MIPTSAEPIVIHIGPVDRLWSEYCCTTLIQKLYINVIVKKLVCGECYMTKLTFLESEVTLPIEIENC